MYQEQPWIIWCVNQTLRVGWKVKRVQDHVRRESALNEDSICLIYVPATLSRIPSMQMQKKPHDRVCITWKWMGLCIGRKEWRDGNSKSQWLHVKSMEWWCIILKVNTKQENTETNWRDETIENAPKRMVKVQFERAFVERRAGSGQD